MALHIGDKVALPDIADDASDVCGANSLAKQKDEIGIAEHLRRYFVRAIEPGIVGGVENEPSDLLNRERAAMSMMK